MAKQDDMMRGFLKDGEPHPMTESALAYIRSFSIKDLNIHVEALSSCAIEGNRLGEICSETLSRLLHSKTVSDRYVLGLAWYLSNSNKQRKNEEIKNKF